jgi:conjugal transfer pilus assembly protein TraW
MGHRLATAAFLLMAMAFAVHADAPPDASSATDDLGSVGPQWPIAEDDLLDAIRARARRLQDSGEAAKLEQRMQQQAQEYADTPPSLNLPRAVLNHTAGFDPSIVVPYDIKDATGRVLYPSGTTVNPLEHFAFDETLLFVDANDPQQVAWLRQRLAASPSGADKNKVILTGGSATRLAADLKEPVYFDQNGTLVRKFRIGAVPATVLADPRAPRKQLLVQEFDPREKPQ